MLHKFKASPLGFTSYTTDEYQSVNYTSKNYNLMNRWPQQSFIHQAWLNSFHCNTQWVVRQGFKASSRVCMWTEQVRNGMYQQHVSTARKWCHGSALTPRSPCSCKHRGGAASLQSCQRWGDLQPEGQKREHEPLTRTKRHIHTPCACEASCQLARATHYTWW